MKPHPRHSGESRNPEFSRNLESTIGKRLISIAVFGAGPVQAIYSNIDGGSSEPYFGTGCIDADPVFFNASNPPGADGVYGTLDDGLHLTAESPSMNKGSNAAVPATPTTDIAGQSRIQGGTVDMGAYEGVAGTPTLDAPKLTLTIIETTVSLPWTSVAGATGYTLYSAPYPKADPIGNIPNGDKTSMTASLPDGSAFYVALQAITVLILISNVFGELNLMWILSYMSGWR